ncbi:MAG: HAD-IA family hydrolase [Theionarchaea archaeon]|nr:HAD-IA family hydrolase [Theionarchaea archaeon]
MIKAVIFDLDGTLTDCDVDLAKKRVSEELAELTGNPYEDIRKKVEDIHYQYNIESIYDRNMWWDQVNPHVPPQEKQRLTNVYWKHITETTRVKDYCEELLRALKDKGLLLVLLTDFDGESYSKKSRISSLSIIPLFDLIIISGEDTEKTKPSPEPFLHILALLKVAPEEVLMVGDKPQVDLQCADALGMKTLLVEGDYGNTWKNTVKDLRGVHQFIESITA